MSKKPHSWMVKHTASACDRCEYPNKAEALRCQVCRRLLVTWSNEGAGALVASAVAGALLLATWVVCVPISIVIVGGWNALVIGGVLSLVLASLLIGVWLFAWQAVKYDKRTELLQRAVRLGWDSRMMPTENDIILLKELEEE